MPNLQDNYNELLGMLTIRNEDIKKKVLALVKEALPGATEIEFRNIYHDEHPQFPLNMMWVAPASPCSSSSGRHFPSVSAVGRTRCSA